MAGALAAWAVRAGLAGTVTTLGLANCAALGATLATTGAGLARVTGAGVAIFSDVVEFCPVYTAAACGDGA